MRAEEPYSAPRHLHLRYHASTAGAHTRTHFCQVLHSIGVLRTLDPTPLNTYSCERVFSLLNSLKNMFTEQQMSALGDYMYIRAALFLKYNQRTVG